MKAPRSIRTRKSAALLANRLYGIASRFYGVAQIEAMKEPKKRFLMDDEIAAIAELRSHANKVLAMLERAPGQVGADSNGSNDDANGE
jgi:hypothetical protein